MGNPTTSFGGLVPYLFYDDAAAMLEWYQRVFGFVEKARWSGVDGRVENAEMLVGDSELWLDGGGARHFDKDGNRADAWIGVWVDDPGAMHQRVVAAGVEANPPEDKPYRVRMLTVSDAVATAGGSCAVSTHDSRLEAGLQQRGGRKGVLTGRGEPWMAEPIQE